MMNPKKDKATIFPTGSSELVQASHAYGFNSHANAAGSEASGFNVLITI
jgi:hypothetical protein